jgi:LysR family transcriptional regulator, regulator for bpeEF and oprC
MTRWLERLTGIQEFLAVADVGSFVGAAEKLGVTPSAVGKAIQRLEGRIGVRLLTRTTRRVALTEDGALFRERWQGLLRDIDLAESEIDARRTQITGPIRVAAPVAYGRLKIVPTLAQFLQTHTEVQLDLRLSDKVIDPVEERVDLVVRIGELEDSSMWARRIDRIRFAVFASPAYLNRHPPLQQPSDLQAHIRLGFLLNSGKPLQFTLKHDEVKVSFAPTPQFMCNDIEGIIAAAQSGLGLAYLPTFIVHNAVAEGSLQMVLEAFSVDGPPVHLLYPQPKQMPNRVRKLADQLLTIAA